ncbi:septal ring lytic transglycosylase RlpA family protein [Rubritalea spongiae]|uniref:Septal ring lytic transglycosylase RlpA family protein n=1 Tax=Rubritalea spongiae TaxID=430797 RepID=A0ABW5EA65_9BACT
MKPFLYLSAILIPFLSSCATHNTSSGKDASVKIKDKKYRVVDVQHGKMSWYSVKTNYGTATASGEKFTNHGHTAAHKRLKMGTMVRVTNLENGNSKVVRINDRGPYKPGRIIDVAVGLSHGDYLDFHNDGVVHCKVEVLEEVPSS